MLGKHSGRHALSKALEEMGFELDGQALNTAFKRFKEIADRKKQVTAMDLEALVTDELREEIAGYALEWFEVEASSRRPPHARVSVTLPDGSSRDRLVHRRRPDRRRLPGDQRGHRRRARSSATSRSAPSPRARTRSARSRSCSRSTASRGAGQGVSTDIIDAAARAYVRALSVAVARSLAAERGEAAPLRRADAVGERDMSTRLRPRSRGRCSAQAGAFEDARFSRVFTADASSAVAMSLALDGQRAAARCRRRHRATPRASLHRACERAVALDLTPAMLERGKAAAALSGIENVVFMRGDATALAVPRRLVRPRA